MSEKCKHESPTLYPVEDGLVISYCEDCNKSLWQIEAEELKDEKRQLENEVTDLKHAYYGGYKSGIEELAKRSRELLEDNEKFRNKNFKEKNE